MTEQSEEPYEATREEVEPRPDRPDHEADEKWAFLGDDDRPESALPRLTAQGGKE